MSWHAYVFPCPWEDHCKIGFSRDPLARIQQFHPRWFECFDLDGGALVDADRERDARDIELRLRGPLGEHRAPMPLTINDAAGGFTEWVRGAQQLLDTTLGALQDEGYIIHAPLNTWMRARFLERCDRLHDWGEAMLPEDDNLHGFSLPQLTALRNQIDACRALGIKPAQWFSERVMDWAG